MQEANEYGETAGIFAFRERFRSLLCPFRRWNSSSNNSVVKPRASVLSAQCPSVIALVRDKKKKTATATAALSIHFVHVQHKDQRKTDNKPTRLVDSLEEFRYIVFVGAYAKTVLAAERLPKDGMHLASGL